MKKQIHIGVAEDHDLVRQGFVALLRDYDNIKVLFDVRNGKELLDRLKTSRPDVILLDLEMPIISGKDALPIIKKTFPNIKVIVISAFYEPSFIIENIKNGANSFLAKGDCKIDKLMEAICAVHQHGVFFDSETSILLANKAAEPAVSNRKSEFDKNQLSEQDLKIIRLICDNKTSKEIAVDLSLSVKTIEWHRAKILDVTGCKNLTALIKFAIQNKIVTISNI